MAGKGAAATCDKEVPDTGPFSVLWADEHKKPESVVFPQPQETTAPTDLWESAEEVWAWSVQQQTAEHPPGDQLHHSFFVSSRRASKLSEVFICPNCRQSRREHGSLTETLVVSGCGLNERHLTGFQHDHKTTSTRQRTALRLWRFVTCHCSGVATLYLIGSVKVVGGLFVIFLPFF